MYILPSTLDAEFRATPTLIRLAQSSDHGLACILIKAGTLELKYISLASSIDLRFFRVGHEGEFLAYAMIFGSAPDTYIIWSVAEWISEVGAIKSLIENSEGRVSLFNELSVNVAEANFSYTEKLPSSVISDLTLYQRPDPRGEIPTSIVKDAFAALEHSRDAPLGYQVELRRPDEGWQSISLTYITDSGRRAPFSLFSTDEGAQQEELATWLVSHLRPTGSARSPQFRDGKQLKELTDLFLSYEAGFFLIESKALAILTRQQLPARDKLRHDLEKDVRKAVRQLCGALRSIRSGRQIVDSDGNHIEFRRPIDAPHLIVLVPDVELLAGVTEFGGEQLRLLARKNQAYFHFLDPKELLRVVQAGELTVRVNADRNSEIEAVDLYLARRFKLALGRHDPNFEVLARADGR